MKAVLILLAGVMFGAGLVISGMTDPMKVVSFLDISGEWDASLAFVMGGALAVYGGGLLLLKKRSRQCLPDTSADPLSRRYMIGSALFGVGWGLSGFCPGPALANLVTGRIEVVLFVLTMLVGMRLAQRVFSLDR